MEITLTYLNSEDVATTVDLLWAPNDLDSTHTTALPSAHGLSIRSDFDENGSPQSVVWIPWGRVLSVDADEDITVTNSGPTF